MSRVTDALFELLALKDAEIKRLTSELYHVSNIKPIKEIEQERLKNGMSIATDAMVAKCAKKMADDILKPSKFTYGYMSVDDSTT